MVIFLYIITVYYAKKIIFFKLLASIQDTVPAYRVWVTQIRTLLGRMHLTDVALFFFWTIPCVSGESNSCQKLQPVRGETVHDSLLSEIMCRIFLETRPMSQKKGLQYPCFLPQYLWEAIFEGEITCRPEIKTIVAVLLVIACAAQLNNPTA